MRSLWKLTFVEVKLFLREPAAVFFTLAFPLLILLLFGSVFGDEPVPGREGLRGIDVSAPGYTALVIGTVALIGLPTNLALYRERGILRRLRATPVHPLAVLVAQVLTSVLMTALGIALLLVAAWLFYGLKAPESPLSVLLALVLGSLSFFAVGFVLAGLLPTVRVASAVGQAIFFPMLFLSGAMLPLEMLPEAMQRVSEFLPLTYAVTLTQDLWLGEGWNALAPAVLVATLAVAVAVSVLTFRWE